MAQAMPAITASTLGRMPACMSHGSMISTRPTTAHTIAIHCRPATRSDSAGHANSSTQKGMVNVRIEVLPGSPPDNAQVFSIRKAPVWMRPTRTAPGGGRRDRWPCLTSRKVPSAITPQTVRSAANVNGPATERPILATIHA
jgi:hypothetical protein